MPESIVRAETIRLGRISTRSTTLFASATASANRSDGSRTVSRNRGQLSCCEDCGDNCDDGLLAVPPSCYKFEMSKIIGLEFTPLFKPFKTREQAEKAREKYPERLRKKIGLGVIRRKKKPGWSLAGSDTNTLSLVEALARFIVVVC
jgi:hypothetical protein